MPPSNTTAINNHLHPDFSITLYHPTSKHPHPARPQYTALTAHYTKLPTHTILTITTLEAIQTADGTTLSGHELAKTIRERMATWANPFGAV
eukprot:1375540-Karenia_brevis.AAC.1